MDDWIKQLQSLKELRDAGILSEEELQAERDKIMRARNLRAAAPCSVLAAASASPRPAALAPPPLAETPEVKARFTPPSGAASAPPRGVAPAARTRDVVRRLPDRPALGDARHRVVRGARRRLEREGSSSSGAFWLHWSPYDPVRVVNAVP